jgi:hypothetical protein
MSTWPQSLEVFNAWHTQADLRLTSGPDSSDHLALEIAAWHKAPLPTVGAGVPMVSNHETVALCCYQRTPIKVISVFGENVRFIRQRSVVDINMSIEDLYGVAFKSNHPIDHQLCRVEGIGQQCHIASSWTRVSIFERADQNNVPRDQGGGHRVTIDSGEAEAYFEPHNDQRDQTSEYEAGRPEITERSTPLHSSL